MVGSYFVLSSASMATCLSPSPFPYTVFTSAAQFASSGKYGLDDKGILTFDYGRAYGGLGRWHNPFFYCPVRTCVVQGLARNPMQG